MVEHRAYCYGYKYAWLCEGCRRWGVTNKNVAPDCFTESCLMYKEQTKLLIGSNNGFDKV